MKKLLLFLMVTFLSLTFIPLQSRAATIAEPSSLVDPKTAENAEATTLLLRLNEIKAKDMSSLKASEKKDLRKEERTINHKLKAIGGGVYLSAGAVILLVILLVVLL
jgi:hypothetical protein